MDQNTTALPVDYEALMAKQLALIAKRVTARTENIRVGQNKVFTFPDGTETSEPFDAVIIDFVSANSYYPSSFNAKDITPPDCFALGEDPTLLIPSHKAINKQAENCASCPQNQWGSGNGQGKACRNTRVLALMPPDATEDTPIWLLKLSPSALKNFDAYVVKLARRMSKTPVGVISKIGFDPRVSYPVVAFGEPRPNPNLGLYMSRQEEAREMLLTEPDFSGSAKQEKPAVRSTRTNIRG